MVQKSDFLLLSIAMLPVAVAEGKRLFHLFLPYIYILKENIMRNYNRKQHIRDCYFSIALSILSILMGITSIIISIIVICK